MGCGDGNFLAFLKRLGWAVSGCEFGEGAVRLAKARHGISTESGDITEIGLQPASLEVVGAYHVFEHVYNPLEWLRAVRRALKPDGLLHLQLPNARCLDRRLAQSCWSAWCFPQHVYFYSPRAIRELLEREGFKTLSLVTYDPWHSPGAVSASFRNCIRKGLRGEEPWANWQPAGDAPPADGIRAEASRPRGRVSRVILSAEHLAAVAFARAESWVRLGNVVDVIAVARGGSSHASRI